MKINYEIKVKLLNDLYFSKSFEYLSKKFDSQEILRGINMSFILRHFPVCMIEPTFPTAFFEKCIYVFLAKKRNLKRQSC